MLGTEEIDVKVYAHYIFLCVKSCKELFGLAMLTKYICGITEGTSKSSTYSPAFNDVKLSDMEYFGVLNKTHCRQDYMLTLLNKLTGRYLEEYFVDIPELESHNQRS
jgi:hypothetical protein